MTAIIFDTLKFVKGAESVGIKPEHAEFQANELAKLINDQLVTKSFLSNQLKDLELNLIKWMIGVALGNAGLIIAMLKFGH